MLHTTLNLCKENDACIDGYRTLKQSLPKSHGKDQPISLLHILESNGLEDAIWALRATIEDSKEIMVEFAVSCAENVLHIYEQYELNDSRVRDCIKYQVGEISLDDLMSARAAAGDAAWAAAGAAAGAAARAAGDAAWAAAGDAWAAAGAATRAAWDAGAAESNYQKQLFIKLLKGEK